MTDEASPPVRGSVPSSRTALAVWLVLTVLAWSGLVAVLFFGLWLATWLWLGVLFVWALAGTVVLVTSTGMLVHLARRRRHGAVAAALAVLVAAGVGVGVVEWDAAFARGWFALHRAAFVAVGEQARAGAFGPVGDWGYYGPELPAGLADLSVNGAVARIGESSGEPVLFVPAWIGIPDGAVGFAQFAGEPEPGVERRLDGFGDPVRPRYALGDGWWWVS